MLEGLTRRVIAAPKTVLALTVVLLVLCGLYGLGAADKMLAGGFEDPNAESSHASEVINNTFDRGGATIIVKLDGPQGMNIAEDPQATALGQQIVADLEETGYVQGEPKTIWNSPHLRDEFVSRDGTSTVIVASLSGDESAVPGQAQEIEELIVGRDADDTGIDVQVGGQALVFQQIDHQTRADLAVAEAVAIPISFLLLILVFGGLVAAALPVLIGIVAIVSTLALLRFIAELTDVSIFALNLTTAMGLALAIDYTLLIVTRYREEVGRGRTRPEAIVRTMDTAGRTVLFSAVTVALSLAALAIFPMYFLRSFAYAGVGVVAVAALAAIIVTPALLMALGDRVDALDLRKFVRRVLRRPEPQPQPIERSFFYRIAAWVLRRAVPVAIVVTTVLVLLGIPFTNIKFGFPDDRVLPASASSRQVQDEIRADYEQNAGGQTSVVVTGFGTGDELAAYSADLSRVDGVELVTSPAGIFAAGERQSDGSPGDERDGVALLTVISEISPMTADGEELVHDLRSVPQPGTLDAQFTGLAAQNSDVVASLYRYLPWVLLLIAVATYLLLFLFTGSVVLPLKALVLNVLSLSATFGAMVWIFQEGHLGGFGTEPMGHLVATMPVLMFCIAFGLSMDYEVFLLGRIREEWLHSDQTREANDRAVAIGLARTGRVVTAAALLMSIVFLGIAASEVSFMRMFGIGLALAVLMDATIIRMLLVPAFMRLAGRWNWWAPGPLRRLHDRFGLSEEKAEAETPAGHGRAGDTAEPAPDDPAPVRGTGG